MWLPVLFVWQLHVGPLVVAVKWDGEPADEETEDEETEDEEEEEPETLFSSRWAEDMNR